MTKPTQPRAPKLKSTDQQTADFTAEGAPSPGMVASSAPPVVAAAALTTNQGLRLADNHNSLKAGARGPTLLEDFILREKITHFDHERIPERAVHARGAGAHGFFEVYASMAEFTSAGFLADPTVQTPVFVRFSTVAGSRGSADTVRDARGFVVKFYTAEGNYDLVGNNIPVFFIQDAIKFPDLVHAVKPEPDREMPQAASAHDTFWDFVSLMPETTHMLMWVMSDRALPRSYRMMQGFGVHTFRFINAQGIAHFAKLHWKPKLGTHGLVWDEAQKIAGKDADFHRRDLWEAIAAGAFPEWELGVQLVPEADEQRFDFDLLDPTKLIPEELVPVRPIGRMVLNRNPDNFFAETEQVAFHPGHLVPGIDFSNDPLLQGRLFSYTDTQLSRLGGPNFHELPVNKSRCPMHNFQRDGMHRQLVPSGAVAYEPNDLESSGEYRVDGQSAGFSSYPETLASPKLRQRSASFDDHFSQARMFWISQSVPEQDHIVAAFQFELSKLTRPALRQRMVDNLAHVDTQLAARVAAPLGIAEPDPLAAARRPGFRAPPKQVKVKASPALSMAASGTDGIATRKVAIVLADGVDGKGVAAVHKALVEAGAQCQLVAATLVPVTAADGSTLPIDCSFVNTPSLMFDAVYVPSLGAADAVLSANGDAVHFVLEAYKHCKTIGASGLGAGLLQRLGVPDGEAQAGLLLAASVDKDFIAAFIAAIGLHRHWDRGHLAKVAA